MGFFEEKTPFDSFKYDLIYYSHFLKIMIFLKGIKKLKGRNT